jgi:tetratricopeptide (TPR) repeat protein
MLRSLLAAVAAVSVAGAAPAADVDVARPYDYRIILRIAPHRLLTQEFRRQLRDELQDGVQAALGPLAVVDVVSAAAAPDAWLDPNTLGAHSETGPAKRHFIEVSFADGRYTIRARQHDGSTGLASPLVREARTADRGFVGRLITRCIEQDFGPVGTVIAFDKANDHAVLEIRGGNLASAELDRMIPAGSVFALARIQGSPPRGRPVEAAYLVTLAEPKDGRCECRFVYRYDGQLADWAAVPYRALMLGAGRAPVRLRFVDRTGLAVSGLQVLVSADGFRTETVRDQGAIRDGGFDTQRAYDRIAYVLVTSGRVKVAQIPVPVIDDRTTLCQVTPAEGGEARQQIELDARNLHQRLVDILHRLAAQHERLKRDVDAQSHAAALDEITRGLDRLDDELAVLTAEAMRLRREAGRTDSVRPILEQCDLFVGEIRKRRDRLRQDQDDLRSALKSEADQVPQRDTYLALLNRANAHLRAAEFDEALQTYDEILNKIGERQDVRKRKEALEAKWKIKNDAQRQARAFVYGAWSNMHSVEDVRANLPKAREAFETLKQVGDRLTPQKLLLAAPAAADIMEKAVEEIKKSESDVEKLNLKPLQQLSAELFAFIKEVSDYVRADDKP